MELEASCCGGGLSVICLLTITCLNLKKKTKSNIFHFIFPKFCEQHPPPPYFYALKTSQESPRKCQKLFFQQLQLNGVVF